MDWTTMRTSRQLLDRQDELMVQIGARLLPHYAAHAYMIDLLEKKINEDRKAVKDAILRAWAITSDNGDKKSWHISKHT